MGPKKHTNIAGFVWLSAYRVSVEMRFSLEPRLRFFFALWDGIVAGNSGNSSFEVAAMVLMKTIWPYFSRWFQGVQCHLPSFLYFLYQNSSSNLQFWRLLSLLQFWRHLHSNHGLVSPGWFLSRSTWLKWWSKPRFSHVSSTVCKMWMSWDPNSGRQDGAGASQWIFRMFSLKFFFKHKNCSEYWYQFYSQIPGSCQFVPPPRVVQKNAATCVRCLAEDVGNTHRFHWGRMAPLALRVCCSQTDGLIIRKSGSDGCKVVVFFV